MRCSFTLALLLVVTSMARAAEQGEIPTFENPRLLHVTVENAQPGKYLSICPNLCELADGSLLIAYHRTTHVDFSGTYDTWTRVSRDGGKTWSDARLFAKHLQAPGVVRLRAGDILLNGCTVLNDRWSTTMRLFRSKDGGQTWAEEKPIWEKSKGIRLQGGCASLVQLKSGRIAYDWHRIPWDRSVKTGGVRIAIANQVWLESDPAMSQSPVRDHPMPGCDR